MLRWTKQRFPLILKTLGQVSSISVPRNAFSFIISGATVLNGATTDGSGSSDGIIHLYRGFGDFTDSTENVPTGDWTDDLTTLNVDDISVFSATGGVLRVGEELIQYTGVTPATQPSAWPADTAVALDATCIPSSANGHWYKATAIGSAPHKTAASPEPTWPTDGSTVTDNDITWTDMGLIALTGATRGYVSSTAAAHAAGVDIYKASILGTDPTFRSVTVGKTLAAYTPSASAITPLSIGTGDQFIIALVGAMQNAAAADLYLDIWEATGWPKDDPTEVLR